MEFGTNEIVQRNTSRIKKFVEEYSIQKKPIEVSFRSLLPEVKNTDRYSHLIHSYPAKLLFHIPLFFLNNTYFSQVGDTILDPFCGTGTVLLEAILAKRNALGADANPLARLLAKVKTNYIDDIVLKENLITILNKARRIKKIEIPDVVNKDYWFPKQTQEQLSKLLRAIKQIENLEIREFFFVCFSNCVKKVSLCDPRIAVPVKLNSKRYPPDSEQRIKIEQKLDELESVDVFKKFFHITSDNIDRIKSLKPELTSGVNAKVIAADARQLTNELESDKKLRANTVKLVITSPPYAGAQKYIRSSSLNIGWLELAQVKDLRTLEDANIGRETFVKKDLVIQLTGIDSADKLIKEIEKINLERGCIVSSYLIEMLDALKESYRVLRKGGHMIIIVGNNKVCNLEFNTQEYFTEYVTSLGGELIFKLIDDIRSYGLMTKRNKTADIISREWVLVFKKK